MERFRTFYKIVSGISAAYLVTKLTNDKVEDLVDECESIPEAALLGAGQAALALAAGTIVAAVVGNDDFKMY